MGGKIYVDRKEAGEKCSVVAADFAREAARDDQTVDRVNEHRQHGKVHQKDLNEQRGTAKEAHPDGDRPANAVVKNGFPGVVTGFGHAGHAEQHAEENAADDATDGELERHADTFRKQRPVFG